MSDTVVLVLTAVLAVSVLGWTVWSIWHIARCRPTRQRALTHVLGGLAGTALLGVVIPAVLKGAFDPIPIWLAFAVLAVVAAAVLGWRWQVLGAGQGRHPGLVITSGVLLVVLAMGLVAVT